MNIKRILLIEDDRRWIAKLTAILKKRDVYVSTATTISSAEDNFLNENAFDMVIIDGCIESNTLDSLPLINKLRNEYYYTGLIVATSSDKRNIHPMLNAGCNEGIQKFEIVEYLNKLEYT